MIETIILDIAGRRSGIDRREFCFTAVVPERRSGIERRMQPERRRGSDRRGELSVQITLNRRSAVKDRRRKASGDGMAPIQNQEK